MELHRPSALLWSGGIGDFLHYAVRLTSFLERRGLTPEQVQLFVEATNPNNVRSMIDACLLGITAEFVPPAWHWTKVNPLLNPRSELERRMRPAYCHVAAQGYRDIADWFLPFACLEYELDRGCLGWLAARAAGTGGKRRVIVSARDKGARWFPSEEVDRELRRLLPEWELGYIGAPDERQSWMEPFVVAPLAADALALAVSADLYVGTDTGLATGRELLGLPNVYCLAPD